MERLKRQEKVRTILEKANQTLAKFLDIDTAFLRDLVAEDVITDEQRDIIKTIQINGEQVDELLKIINVTTGAYDGFMTLLSRPKTKDLYDYIKDLEEKVDLPNQAIIRLQRQEKIRTILEKANQSLAKSLRIDTAFLRDLVAEDVITDEQRDILKTIQINGEQVDELLKFINTTTGAYDGFVELLNRRPTKDLYEYIKDLEENVELPNPATPEEEVSQGELHHPHSSHQPLNTEFGNSGHKLPRRDETDDSKIPRALDSLTSDSSVNPNAHFRNGTNAPTYVYGNQIIITDNQTVVCGNQTIVAGPAPDQKRAKKDLELTEDQQGKHEGLLGTSRDTSDFLDAQNIPKIVTVGDKFSHTEKGPCIVGNFDLKTCQEQLTWYYLNYLCKVPMYPGDNETCVDLDDIYTRVSIVLELSQPGQSIKMPLKSHNEIFTRRSTGLDVITRILISGEAGVGKSMLTAKLAHDWAKRDTDTNTPLADIHLLFVLNMRWIQRSSNIEEVILAQLLPDDTSITEKDLSNMMRHLGSGVTLILDAIDETDREFFTDPKQSGNIVRALMGKNLLTTRIIVTTRPWRVGEIVQYNKTLTKFELHGFAKEDIAYYVRHFFSREQQLGEKLIHYMEENAIVTVVAAVPLMALLFCLYWKETGGKGIPNRIGLLYDSILHIMENHLESKRAEKAVHQKQLKFIYRHLHNLVTIFKPRPGLKDVVRKLGKPALDGIWPPENRLVFSTDELQEEVQPVIVEEASEMGLLSRQNLPSILAKETKASQPTKIVVRNIIAVISIVSAVVFIAFAVYVEPDVAALLFGTGPLCLSYWMLWGCPQIIRKPPPHIVNKQQTITFFHKSAQEKCAGEYLASLAHQQPDQMQVYLNSVTTLKDALSIDPILRFACSASSEATRKILEKLLALYTTRISPWMTHFREEKLGLDDTRTIQQFVDLCLGCNYEADAKDEHSAKLTQLFPQKILNSLGMGSMSAVSIGYFMEHNRSDPIRSITLRPVAHIGDPLVVDEGPLASLLQAALHGIQLRMSEGQVRKICEAYLESRQGKVREEIKVMANKSPAMMLAHLQVLQACEGFHFPGEADLAPLLKRFEFTKIDCLNFSGLKLGSNIDHLISVIEIGHLYYLLELNLKGIGMNGFQTERLAKSLNKTPQINLLDISWNEAGRSFYSLSRSLEECPSLWVLNVGDMSATVDSTAALMKAIPHLGSELEQLKIEGNDMNEDVATHFSQNISSAKSLLCLDISVVGLSRDSHSSVIDSCGGLPRLVKLGIWGSPFPDALLKGVSQVMGRLPSLRYLRLNGHYNVSPNVTHSTWLELRRRLQVATALNFLALINVSLQEDDFRELLAMCRRLGYAYLGYSMDCLPDGVGSVTDKFFHIL